MREYLKRCMENGQDEITVIGYQVGGKSYSKGTQPILDVVDLDTGQYVSDHVCLRKSALCGERCNLIVARAKIYRYERANGWGADYGLNVKKILLSAMVYVLRGEFVLIPNGIKNVWHFTAQFQDSYRFHYRQYNKPAYDNLWYNGNKFNIYYNSTGVPMLFSGFTLPDDAGYRVWYEHEGYYLLYYAEKGSRIKAYRSVDAWLHDYEMFLSDLNYT